MSGKAVNALKTLDCEQVTSKTQSNTTQEMRQKSLLSMRVHPEHMGMNMRATIKHCEDGTTIDTNVSVLNIEDMTMYVAVHDHTTQRRGVV